MFDLAAEYTYSTLWLQST